MTEETEFIKKLNQFTEDIKTGMSEKDIRFFNLRRFVKMTRKMDDFPECKVCIEKKTIALQYLEQQPDSLVKNPNAYEKLMDEMEKHLRKSHHVRFKAYYMSLYSMIGILVGLIFFALASWLWVRGVNLSICLIGGAIGLLIGRLIAFFKEKKAEKMGQLI